MVWAAASGISISAGPLAGGLMLSAGLWWGSVLALVAVLALIALLASLVVVPRLPASGTGELRFLPVILSIGGVGLLVLGVLDGGQTSDWLGLTTLCPVVVGLALLAVLIVTEGRRDDALADVRLFRDRGFAMSVLALSVAALVVFGAMYLLTFYLQVARGYTPFQTGLLFIPMSAGLVIGAPISRRLVGRLGTGPTIATGLLLITVAMAVIAFYSMTTSVVLILSVFLALALGFALVLSPGTTAAMSTVPGARVGAGSALLNTARQVSSASGSGGSRFIAVVRLRLRRRAGPRRTARRETGGRAAVPLRHVGRAARPHGRRRCPRRVPQRTASHLSCSRRRRPRVRCPRRGDRRAWPHPGGRGAELS